MSWAKLGRPENGFTALKRIQDSNLTMQQLEIFWAKTTASKFILFLMSFQAGKGLLIGKTENQTMVPMFLTED
jgi:hypothetical protein